MAPVESVSVNVAWFESTAIWGSDAVPSPLNHSYAVVLWTCETPELPIAYLVTTIAPALPVTEPVGTVAGGVPVTWSTMT